MEPELIVNHECECGENPLWHPLEKKLYWVDINKRKGYFGTIRPTERARCAYEDVPVGGFTIQQDGALLLFRTRGEVVIWKNGKNKDSHQRAAGRTRAPL